MAAFVAVFASQNVAEVYERSLEYHVVDPRVYDEQDQGFVVQAALLLQAFLNLRAVRWA